jgi:F0F1-type ATP synthase membrane subunit b/b'
MGLAGDEETQQLLGEITNLDTSASDLAMGIATKNPVQIIQGTIGVVTSLFEIFDKRSRDAQREIRKQEQAVKDLQKAYKALEQEVKKALSTDYYSKQVDQARNLEQQIQRVYAMIRAEESKRKRKRDQDKIEGWRNEIDDLRNQAADIRRAVIDELMTTDLRSFSSQLASSMLQGYAEGMEDLESVVQGSMDDLMRSMITKQFDMLVAQKLLKPLFDAMERSINVDAGDFTFDENDLQQIRAAGQGAKNSLLEAGEGFRDILKGLGLDNLNEQERQGAKKGIANASQESIDDLTGRVTNIQSHTYSISNDFKALLNSTNIIVKHMMNIDTNTKRLETIENDISEVRKGIDTINLKGVQLR